MMVNTHTVPDPPGDAFWVFGYGSLMWRPGFEYTSLRRARLFGYRRALCILSHVYRGSPDRPGIVFGLDAGGSCVGHIFRVARSRRLETYDYLMKREMVRAVYRPRWLPVSTGKGRVTALVFVADRGHEQYVSGLTERQCIDRIKQARGRNGSNAHYILNTCRHLESLGIRPQELARIRDAIDPTARVRTSQRP